MMWEDAERRKLFNFNFNIADFNDVVDVRGGLNPAYPDFSEMRLSDFGEIIIGRGDSYNLNLPFTVPKNHFDYYRAYKSELDDNELCDVLAFFKED